MVPTPCPSPIVALVAPVKLTKNVSGGSTALTETVDDLTVVPETLAAPVPSATVWMTMVAVVAPGGIVFNKGEPGDCMYIVQSGVIDMVIGDTVIETIGANEALGFMSMIDEMPRSSTARAREACELSLIDARTFRFMVDEVPNFSTYIMRVLARRIRGMSKAL